MGERTVGETLPAVNDATAFRAPDLEVLERRLELVGVDGRAELGGGSRGSPILSDFVRSTSRSRKGPTTGFSTMARLVAVHSAR